MEKFEAVEGKQPGDPTKAAGRIVEAVSGTGMAGSVKGKALRMPLGPDCVGRYEQKVKRMGDDLETVRQAAMSTDFD